MQNTTVIDWQELCRVKGKYTVPDNAKAKKPTLREGSCSTSIPDEFVAQHLESCRKTWLNLTGGEVVKGNRYLVHPDDAAVVLLIALETLFWQAAEREIEAVFQKAA